MLLVLIEWIFIFIISLGYGLGGLKILRLKRYNFLDLSLLGFLLLLCLTTAWASLYKVGLSYFFFNTSVSLVLIARYRKDVSALYIKEKRNFLLLSYPLRFLFFLYFFLALMQSSTMPYIPDNESYYLQSIKWLNEYGLVNGLANIHIYLAQISGWHLLQSSLNLSFLFPNLLNDINGYLFILLFVFSLSSIQRYRKTKDASYFVFGAFAMGSVFIFQFINTPSPDLPVFLICPYLFYLFYHLYQKEENFPSSKILVLFCGSLLLILIKITTAPLLSLTLILFLHKHKLLKSNYIVPIMLLSVMSLCVFMLRNHIISGYPLYPLPYLSLQPDWKIAPELQEYYYTYTKMHAYLTIDGNEFAQLNSWEKWGKWLDGPKLHGFFNKLIVLSLMVSPLLIKKNKAYLWLYVYCLFQFIILYFTSAQYRFFIHLLLFLLPLIFIGLFSKHVYSIYYLFITSLNISAIIILVLLFNPISLAPFTNNKFMDTSSSNFKLSQLITPHKNSRYSFDYKMIKKGDFSFYSPTENLINFWVTGDGPLPSVYKKQLDYFEDTLLIRPSTREKHNLKKGFHFERIEKK